VPPSETLDALSGWMRIFQLRDGHRYSTDDLLAAWYGTQCCPSAARVLELGSGIGSVGMIAAWRLQGAHFTTIEAQTESVRLAKKSIALNGLEQRFTLIAGDFREPSLLDREARFDLVLGSPPYFPIEAGVAPDHPQKVSCRFEMRGNISDYCAVAARHLGPGGVFACVFPVQPAHQMERVRLAARDAGLTLLRMRSIVLLSLIHISEPTRPY